MKRINKEVETMKNKFSTLLKNSKILLGVGLLVIAGLTSCDNFMKSTDVRDEIMAAIEYNNALSCPVLLKADSDKGEFIQIGDNTFKIGYESKVQFVLNQDLYIFKELQAKCVGDETKDCKSIVDIKLLTSDDKKGIYTYSIKPLVKVDDLMIYPVCLLIPEVETSKITPRFESSGCDQDTAITISFNKAVDPTTFTGFSCISISDDNGDDIWGNFTTPYFSEDKKTLVIPANLNKLILPPDGSKNTMIIRVRYDFANQKDCDGLLINQSGTHEYKISKNFGNQKKVTVLIDTDTTKGKFLSSGEKECTVGYALDLQLTVDQKNYRFIDFEAVSSKDNTSREESVTFEDITRDDDNGIYWAKVRINKEDNDILIRALCAELPAVASYSPASSTEQNYTNTLIVITLSQPIEASTLSDNLSIKYNNTDRSDLFENPVYDSNNKTIKINPKINDLKAFIESLGLTYVDFQVTLSNKIYGSSNGINLPLKQNEKTTFTVRYKSQIDTTPPVKTQFFATREPITLATAKNLSDDSKFLIERFEDDYEKCLRNINNGTIYIYGKYYDKNNAIKNVVVQRRNVHFDTIDSETVYTVGSDNIELSSDGNGNTEFCIKYDVKSWRNNLSCYVTNTLDYESIPVNFTVYGNLIELSGILFYNYLYEEMEDGEFDIDSYKENYKTVKISYNPDFVDDGSFIDGIAECLITEDENGDYDYTQYKNYYDSYLFECEYKDDDGVTHTETMLNNKTEMCFYCNLENIEYINGLKFLLKVTDRIQTHSEIELQFPVATAISNISKNGGSAYVSFVPGNSIENEYMIRNEFLIEEYNGSYELTNLWDDTDNEIHNSSSYNYYTIPSYCSYQGVVYLCGDISQLNTDATPNNLSNVQLDGIPTYKKGRSVDGGNSVGYRDYMEITVKIVKDSWDIFDSIYIEFEDNNGNPKYFYFNKNECSMTLEKYVSRMYQGNTPIKVYGVKDNIRSSATVYTIEQLESSSTCGYDYLKPTLEVTRIDYDNYKVQLIDNESGPDYGYVFDIMDGDDYKYKLNSSNNWTVIVPVWELLDIRSTRGQRISLKAEGFDKYGNKDDVNGFIPIDGYVQRSESPLNWHYKYVSGVGTTSFVFDTRHSEYVNLYKFNTSTGTWTMDKEKLQKGTRYTDAGDGYYYYRYTYSNPPADTFIRVAGISYYDNYDDNSCPSYFYTGTQNSGDYDLLIPNGGTSSTEFAVSSDSAVFVHTIVTKRPECTDWWVYDWEDFRKHIGEKQLSFSPTDHGPKRYKVPVEKINPGEYYVVIAHYADGTTAMSSVMQMQ